MKIILIETIIIKFLRIITISNDKSNEFKKLFFHSSNKACNNAFFVNNKERIFLDIEVENNKYVDFKFRELKKIIRAKTKLKIFKKN